MNALAENLAPRIGGERAESCSTVPDHEWVCTRFLGLHRYEYVREIAFRGGSRQRWSYPDRAETIETSRQTEFFRLDSMGCLPGSLWVHILASERAAQRNDSVLLKLPVACQRILSRGGRLRA